jgi:hypothetical protein
MGKNVDSKIEIDKIDIIFTWVDYKHKEWIKKKNQDAIKNNIVKHNNNNRYNSNLNEIKYAVRSIEKYFKNKYRNIYFVTNTGKLPGFLKRHHTNLIPIHYETLVGTTSYNSCTIESCLYKIPGLSEYYLYFNDDTILSKKLHINDVITKDGKLIWYSESNKIINMFNTYPDLSKIFKIEDGGCNLSRQKTYKLLKLDETPRPIAHSPKIFKKSLVEKFCHIFSKQINDQMHRKFRSIDDFCFIDAFCFYFEKNKLLHYRHDYETKILCQFDNIVISKIINNIIDSSSIKDCKFICVEDYREGDNIDTYCKKILDDLFPSPCKYESKYEKT